MKRAILVVLVFVLAALSFVGRAVASQPANVCPGPCNVCGADGVTCYSRWWQDLDTYTIEAYPVQINRTAAGKLNYSQCQYIPGTQMLVSWCGGVKPEKITLREWCRRLMALPVPPRLKPEDPGDLYVLFSSGGVCP